MKQKFALIFFVGLFFGFAPNPKTLVGRWEITYPDKTVVWVTMHTNESWEFVVNKKVAGVGKYHISHDTISIQGGACSPAYWGKYTYQFYAQDSVRFAIIADTCHFVDLNYGMKKIKSLK